MTRRNSLSAISAMGLVSALALAACGSGGAGDANGDTTLTYWDTSGPNESPVFAEIAQGCAEAGGYDVTIEQVAFDQAINNYKTAAQAGQGPDVLRAEVAWVPQLAEGGLVQDLSDTDLADSADFLATPWSSTQYDGRTYAVPQVTDTLALLYNRELLAEAGVEPPTTWAEVEESAEALGGESTIFLNNDAYYALPFIYGAGGDLLDTENQEILVNATEAVDGLSTAKDLLDAGAAQTALDQGNSYGNMKAAFTAGDVAMIIDGPWAIAELLDGAAFEDPENLGIAPVPGPTDGEGNSPVGGHDYVIRQGSSATESAQDFIACMSSTESQITIATELGLLPTRESAYEDEAVIDQPIVSAFSPVIEQARPRPWIPEGGELFDPLKIAYSDILAGNVEPQAALDEVATTYRDTILTDYSVN
ncbi:extracellular solute-binding protein [Actinoalloteichus hymeniacidonis]|uniref:Carbohydrate ABC transporter substrate-binding protein, CUT1 family n=1 Tax=Actinoalloteichus hymeniacidonis TaxID=340345 RepID=A0AAC9MWL3_9PSEU|nr:extracellular solute-binding protein [Actinoalloteichus hymeniacidonis]AOS61229.1 carbohydrate ABC transporter substrate-binding protein, CUT1 family [Actinoalloteichus hymeniacidonis]MBB5910768.1 arabinogalactan oligomer/maltooligosaccharide transport system substrate-binding protein [Actinoalloteichus hymeniacidonis]